MTSFEHVFDPSRAVVRVMDLLSEERIVREVDQQLDQAAQGFHLEVSLPINHSAFNQLIAAFVKYLYQKGLRLPRQLSNREALSEAVVLLGTTYQGAYTEGYEGAFLDATSDSLEGLEMVLFRLAEALKTAERKKYMVGVFADHIEHLGWKVKEEVISVYLEHYGGIFPEQVRALDPARLVEHFHDLVFVHLSANDVLRKTLGADW